MNVKFLKSGEIKEVNASFASRLIEQGKAVAYEAPKAPVKAEKPAKKNYKKG